MTVVVNRRTQIEVWESLHFWSCDHQLRMKRFPNKIDSLSYPFGKWMFHEHMFIAEIGRSTMLQLLGLLTTTLIINQIGAYDPEAYMNAVSFLRLFLLWKEKYLRILVIWFMEDLQTQMIQYWGYPVEIHEIVTGDGFILRMFRISHGRNSESSKFCNIILIVKK